MKLAEEYHSSHHIILSNRLTYLNWRPNPVLMRTCEDSQGGVLALETQAIIDKFKNVISAALDTTISSKSV